jgi:hypothetical protein
MIRTTKIDSEKPIENEVSRIRNITQWEWNVDRGSLSERILC